MVFRKKVEMYVKQGCSVIPDGHDAFALLETKCATSTFTRATGNHNGHLYKEGIFLIDLTPGKEEKDLEDYVSKILRSLAADFVANNVSLEVMVGAVEVSIETPLGADNKSTIGDILPDETDPATLAARQEYQTIAITLASQIFPQLGRPERVGLAAIFSGLAVSNPDVTAAAGVEKSQLSNRLAMAVKAVKPGKAAVTPKFRGYLETQVARLEGPIWNELTASERKYLIALVYERLCYAAVAWAKSEMDCGFLFQ